VELTTLDAPAEGKEEFLQPGILSQKLLGRECVASDQAAWDEVCQDKSGFWYQPRLVKSSWS
jgi:hypothetical protein